MWLRQYLIAHWQLGACCRRRAWLLPRQQATPLAVASPGNIRTGDTSAAAFVCVCPAQGGRLYRPRGPQCACYLSRAFSLPPPSIADSLARFLAALWAKHRHLSCGQSLRPDAGLKGDCTGKPEAVVDDGGCQVQVNATRLNLALSLGLRPLLSVRTSPVHRM